MRSFKDYKNEVAGDPHSWPEYDKYARDPKTGQLNITKVQAQTDDPEEHLDMAIDQLVSNLIRIIKNAMPTKNDQHTGIFSGIKKWYDDLAKRGRVMTRRGLRKKKMSNVHLGGKYRGGGEPSDLEEDVMPLALYSFFIEATSHIEKVLAEAPLPSPIDDPNAPASNLVGTVPQYKLGDPVTYLRNYLRGPFKADLRKILDNYLRGKGLEPTKPYLKHHQDIKADGGMSLLKPSVTSGPGTAPRGTPAPPTPVPPASTQAQTTDPYGDYDDAKQAAIKAANDAEAKMADLRGHGTPESGLTDQGTATSHGAGSPPEKYGAQNIEAAPEDKKLQAIQKAMGVRLDDEAAQNLYDVYQELIKNGKSPDDAMNIIKHWAHHGTPEDMPNEVVNYQEMLREQSLKNYTPHACRNYVDKLPAEFKTAYYRDLLKKV